MNRLTIRTTARKKLGEATAVFFSDDELNQWINDAQIDLVWNARCKRQRSLCTLTSAAVRYSLTTLIPNVLRIISVRIYSDVLLKWRRLKEVTYDFLDDRYPQWESNDAATPLYYVYSRELDEFILFPKAQADYLGTNYVEVYNSVLPVPLTNDAQSPDIPDILHPAVIEWVVATGLEGRGYQDIADGHWAKYAQKWSGYMSMRDTEEDEELIMRPGR